eukprot:876-Heterococcus_DN1.PRE.4
MQCTHSDCNLHCTHQQSIAASLCPTLADSACYIVSCACAESQAKDKRQLLKLFVLQWPRPRSHH